MLSLSGQAKQQAVEGAAKKAALAEQQHQELQEHFEALQQSFRQAQADHKAAKQVRTTLEVLMHQSMRISVP